MSDDPQHGDPDATDGPDASIGTLVISLASSAAVHFGDLPDAATGQKQPVNLAAAKQMIDLLSVLETKTKGNLTADESDLLTTVLYELRMRFVQSAGSEKKIILP